MANTGRPSTYTDDIANAICARISEGESLLSITNGDDMPTRTTIYDWLSKHGSFANNYARAKDDSADTYADKIAHIGNEVLEGKYDPQAARVAIDAIKWTASKLKPKKYGDRIHTEHSGNIGRELSDDELDAQIADRIAKFQK